MMRMALLSNVTTGILDQLLKKHAEIYTPEGFDTWMVKLLDRQSELYTEEFDIVFLLLHGDAESANWKARDDGFSQMDQWYNAIYKFVSARPDVTVFVSNLDLSAKAIRPVASRRYELEWEFYWYNRIQTLVDKTKNLYVVDLKTLVAREGRKNFYSPKMWYMGSMPISMSGLKAIAQEMENLIQAYSGKRKKALALDLDNTLWGGVVGEDGIDGLKLEDHKEGAIYYDFQKRLQEIKECGTILTVLSKNNEEDALEAIEKHPNMVIRKKELAGFRINWQGKPANLMAMAASLNLGVDAFVFVDDNPMEREMMNSQCPEVNIPEFPKKVEDLEWFAQCLYKKYFLALRATEEDLKKTEMYQQEEQRKAVLNSAGSVEDYIKKLEISIDIHKMRDSERERVIQLCNKTNQFNLTTKRYSKQEIDHFADSDDDDIFVVRTTDKFGDNGLISVVICRKSEDTISIDTFLMSCRVMGRFIENVIIDKLAEYYKNSCKTMIAEYIKTAKNAPVKDLYDKLGFKLIDNGEDWRRYERDLETDHKSIFCHKGICFSAE